MNRTTLILSGTVIALGLVYFLSQNAEVTPTTTEAATPAVISTGPVPDFSSNGTAWRIVNPEGGASTHYRKVPGDTGPGPLFQHPDYRIGVIGDDVNRIPDFNHPILQPWAKEKAEDEAKRIIAGGIPFIPNSRCWPAGVPGFLLLPATVIYLQTPEMVWILNNRGEVRRIRMDAAHSANPEYSWNGESIGHYENGDTLVIDAIGLDDKGPIDRYRTPHTRAMHVVERHTLTPDHNGIAVTIDVDDPGTFTTPWKGLVEFERSLVRGQPAEWEEYSCNENSEEFFIPADQLVPVPQALLRDF